VGRGHGAPGKPTPRLLRRWIPRLGLRTVVCLRQPQPWDRLVELERRVCAEAGVEFAYVNVYSRDMPSAEKLRELHDLLTRIQYPALIHCQGGADRSGLVSTLYLHWIEGVPLEETRQLTFIPHLHISAGPAGLIDRFFDAYAQDCARAPQPLLEWAETRMRREELIRNYRANMWGRLLNDLILRRE
jgi:protein tyrosine/serine phosphatase